MSITKMELSDSQRFKKIFNDILKEDYIYEDNIDEFDFYKFQCQIIAKKLLFKFKGTEVLLSKFNNKNKNSVLILFRFPIDSEETKTNGNKNFNEKIIELISVVENSLIYLDYVKIFDEKEDKFLYLMILKNI